MFRVLMTEEEWSPSPEDYKLNYIIAIGYPDEQPEANPAMPRK